VVVKAETALKAAQRKVQRLDQQSRDSDMDI
jgi:hypothetical protein